jgi:hypothetical protein
MRKCAEIAKVRGSALGRLKYSRMDESKRKNLTLKVDANSPNEVIFMSSIVSRRGRCANLNRIVPETGDDT